MLFILKPFSDPKTAMTQSCQTRSYKYHVVFIAVIAAFLIRFIRTSNENVDVHVEGYVDTRFEKVREVFRQNLISGWERDGGALAVYHKGKLVVDLWGGYADKESDRKWKRDTMNIAFSSSKAVGAVCIAMLVDRGHLSYDDLLVKFWPEFGKMGKENVTVQMIMSHTSGLVIVDTPISFEDALDHKRMSKILEEQSPYWAPGEHLGYHAVTYGWLVDQIVRRADPKKRSIGTFLKEEITDKHGLEFYFGLPLEMAHRVARLNSANIWHRIDEFMTDPGNIDYLHILKDSLTTQYLLKMASNPSWMQTVFKVTMNNPELYMLEQPAALGIGTARDMAKLFELLLDEKIVSKATLDLISKPYIKKNDIVTGVCFERGFGFTYLPVTKNESTYTLVGHAGLGGQNMRYDRENDLAFAYLSNGLKGGLGDSARTYVLLKEAIYDSVFNS
ncbi:hypothetical protein QR680_000774 [Steinernema hermaphroditum]|uniref:Beta-lactamase-related domain-containing protein n=1 Tax=Steinernema hermaphroditum TaxID=289476 RepID=A0AA39GXC5_9BILA|nr:hypothetical protein QR680_000774 [Steinernema hermaphroditum]